MTFNEALEIAVKNNDFIKHHVRNVRAHYDMDGDPTPCVIFAIGREAFSIGYDGIDIQEVKHTEERSRFLIENGYAIRIFGA